MREAACESWVRLASRPDFVFLTGDLGFRALEPLQTAAGPRFINAGVAEQNMVSVAAGLAKLKLRPWVYSIAPFAYARPFEQIRNDVCLHHLPVQIVGNGGGFGYGVMGASHHAIEDYGVLLSLQNMKAWVPAFDEDVWPIVDKMANSSHPGYLRLGRSEKPKEFAVPKYSPWRRLVEGQGEIIISVGPIAGSLVGPLLTMPTEKRPSLWVVSELPLLWNEFPEELKQPLMRRDKKVFVVEEHVAQGGLNQILALLLLNQGMAPKAFHSFVAKGYVSGNYGSQTFHRIENGLDFASLKAVLES